LVKLYSEVLGREVEVPDEPERIVSLSPAITETLYMLGLEDKVAGVSFYCHKPPRASEKPKVGSYYKVLYDRLEDLDPDLVLTTTGAQRKVLDEIVERGYTLYPIPLPVTVYGILDEVEAVGIITGRIEAARRLARRLAKTLHKLGGSLDGVRVYYEIYLGGPVSAGSHSYIDDLLSHLGAVTPYRGRRTTWIINPDPREIIEFNPEVILYEKSPYKEATIEDIVKDFKDRGLGGIKAIEDGRIIILEPDTLAHYGPSIFNSLERIVRDVRRLL